jgi:hypothetical protein
MRYTVWFYAIGKSGDLERKHDCFTGTKYECLKFKKGKNFSSQYRIFRAIW